MAAASIGEVLLQLEAIIADSIRTNNRLGYFAALYYKVTARVKEGIAAGEFENGARMEKLDVLFANRYLDALDQWKDGRPLSGSWKTAFEATRRSRVLVLQHLLLAVNAHINFDLGIAAVETVGDADIQSIHRDFNSINAIIGSLTYEVINEINRVSPVMSLMGLHANNQGSILVQFSVTNARDGAWCFAEELRPKKGTDYDNCIRGRDQDIEKLAGALLKPRGLIRVTLWIIHLFEWKHPGRIIRVLHAYKKTFIKVSG